MEMTPILRRTFITGRAAAVVARAASAPAPRMIGQIGTTHAHAAGKMQAVRGLPELWMVAGLVESDAQRTSTAARATLVKACACSMRKRLRCSYLLWTRLSNAQLTSRRPRLWFFNYPTA